MGGLIGGLFGGDSGGQTSTQKSTEQNNQTLQAGKQLNYQDPNAPVQAYQQQFVRTPGNDTQQNQSSLAGMYTSMNQNNQQQKNNGGFNPWTNKNKNGLAGMFMGGE